MQEALEGLDLGDAVEQLQAVSFSARSLAGVRFGARQIWKSLARRITWGRAYSDPSQVHW